MDIFKTISFFLIGINLIVLSSCSSKYPTPKNPNKGIVTLSYYASNTSRLDFYRYYKIFPSTDPDIIIEIIPIGGNNYAFSDELPPGIYNFDKIKFILDSHVASSSVHSGVEEIKGGITVEVKPGLITPAEMKLYIEQYDIGSSLTVSSRTHFRSIPEPEMKELRLKFQKSHTE